MLIPTWMRPTDTLFILWPLYDATHQTCCLHVTLCSLCDLAHQMRYLNSTHWSLWNETTSIKFLFALRLSHDGIGIMFLYAKLNIIHCRKNCRSHAILSMSLLMLSKHVFLSTSSLLSRHMLFMQQKMH